MLNYTSKLIEKLVIIYEMDGIDAVEEYAREHGIPVYVCQKMLEEYEAAKAELFVEAAE